jgi:hypothetical protein
MREMASNDSNNVFCHLPISNVPTITPIHNSLKEIASIHQMLIKADDLSAKKLMREALARENIAR